MEQPPLRRRRPAKSCIECRRRKIKCDKRQPCGHCVSTKARCAYRTSTVEAIVSQDSPAPASEDLNVRSPGTVAASTSPSNIGRASAVRVTAVEYASDSTLPWTAAAAEAMQQGRVPGVNVARASQAREGSRHFAHRFDIQRGNPSPARFEARLSSQSLRTSKSTDANFGSSKHASAQQPGSQGEGIVLNKTRTLRWSHWIGTAKEFATVVACYMSYVVANNQSEADPLHDDEVRSIAEQIDRLMKSCKDLARMTKVERPSRILSHFGFDLTPPRIDVANGMVDAYLCEWESAFRIVHRPSFLSDYRKCLKDPEGVTTGLRLKTLLVIAIGSSLGKHGDQDDEFSARARQWVYAAQMWLSGPLEKDRVNINGIQVLCLTIIARQIFAIGGDLVWMSAGALVHMAMQIGLHRDPAHFRAMSSLQAELRRRLWATVLELSVQAALDTATPARIDLDEFDTKAPADIDDAELDVSTELSATHDGDVYTSMSPQLALLRCLRPRIEVLQLLNGLRTEISYSNVLALSSEMGDALQAWTKVSHGKAGSGSTAFQRNLVDYLIRRFLLPLHCLFAIKAGANPLFNYSLNISVETAMAMITSEPSDEFSRLTAISGGLFREGFRCALSVITLKMIAQAESQHLDGTLHRSSQQLECLKQAAERMRTLSAQRIRLGETNVKSHLFLSMMLAQVQAIELDEPPEKMIAEHALESLKFCHEVLQCRVNLESAEDTDRGTQVPLNLDGGLESDWMDWNMESLFSDSFL